MTVNTAAAFATQFAAFAADQAKVGLVPLAVNGTEVEYGFDDTAERTQPDPLIKLRSVPLNVTEMLVASGEGEGEAIQQTSLYSEWRGMQESANYLSGMVEIIGHGREGVGINRFGSRASLWRELSAKVSKYGRGGAGHAELIDAAIGALILSRNNCGEDDVIPFECIRLLNRAIFELLKAGRFYGAAMLLESGSAVSLSFLGGMEFFGRRTAIALGRSLTARKKDASIDHLLARGIWYGWFDKLGVSLESFHLASAERDFDIERYSGCAAHYIRMIAARLRRPKLTGADWEWIKDMLGITASIWKEFGGGSVKIEAARKLAVDVKANAGVA
jgi:hypothetical protein